MNLEKIQVSETMKDMIKSTGKILGQNEVTKKDLDHLNFCLVANLVFLNLELRDNHYTEISEQYSTMEIGDKKSINKQLYKKAEFLADTLFGKAIKRYEKNKK